MSYRKLETMNIYELVRLVRAGVSDRKIAKVMGLSRQTVIRYRRWAQEQGLLEGELPDASELAVKLRETMPTPMPPQQTSTVAIYAEEIAALRQRGVELAAIKARLEEKYHKSISYSAIWRLVRHLEPKAQEAMVRVETPPGEEAQVDFGYAGMLLDSEGQTHKGWVFTMVLSWSRHMYAELVFDQKVNTWLLCHSHAFAHFGGVPQRVVPDNLRAAILRASFGGEAMAQQAYRECANHYGFLIDPNPPRSPRLKGKVEQGGVHYIKRNFLAGRDFPLGRDELNLKLWEWIGHTAGTRVHGTTKQRPLERFTAEKERLMSLPPTPYDPAVWKEARVYRDCYLSFDGSYYSVPYRLVGQRVRLRAGARTVEVYDSNHELVAVHDRAQESGERHTLLDHLPPNKVEGLILSRSGTRARAEAIGPATLGVVEAMLGHRPEDRLRSASRVLKLAERFTPERLERACERALYYQEESYPAIKRILESDLDTEPVRELEAFPSAYTFVREAREFAASLLGVSR